MASPDISVDLLGMRLESPLLLASGILGETGPSLLSVLSGGAGGVVTKSIGSEPRDGHPNPTVVEVEGGLLNAIGLANPGIEAYLEELDTVVKADVGAPVIASIFAADADEFADLARRGRQRVLDHYTQAQIAARTYQVYRGLT